MPQTGNIPAGVPGRGETLGYQIIRWCQKYIVHPDGENAGEPWRFSTEQLRFVLWFYAINPDGSWKYSAGTLRRAKGWGKTPLLAAMAIVEFIGPCRFSHFDSKGLPVGRPVPLPVVQLGATALDQTHQTLDMIRGMLSESPAETVYGLEIGKSLVQFRSGKPGSIVPKATAGRTNEGNRPSFVLMDEVHHWVGSNGGPEFYQVLKRNLEKTAGQGSRWIATTNAFNPSEDSIAQQIHESAMVSQGFWLYDCLEGSIDHEDLRDEGLVRESLTEAYGDSYWVDLDALTRVICFDRTTPDSTYMRFYMNRIAESSDGWMSKTEWDECLSVDDIRPGEQIAVGFDGSVRGDGTALVGVRLRDAKVFVLGSWTRPENAPDDWEVDVLAVEAAVKRTFETYRVEWMYCDPPWWQENIGRWSIEYGDDYVFEFWTNKPTRMANAVERFRTAVMVGDLSHTGDPELTRHILNAVAREVPQGILISKDSPRSKRKIDLAVAAVLALEARADAIADGRLQIKRRRVVGF